MAETCKVKGCTRCIVYKAVGMCQQHYWRLKTHGSTDRPIRKVATMAEKIARGLAAGLAQAEEVGDCLEWQGSFSCKGTTPVVKIYCVDKKRTDNFAVPRLIWEAANGPIPKGKLVYRSCHNNACTLDAHLAIGTRKEWRESRKKAGLTKHSTATLVRLTMAARRRASAVNDIEKAREVRMLAAGGARNSEIVAKTGVSRSVVADIRQGRAWKELSSPFAGLGARP